MSIQGAWNVDDKKKVTTRTRFILRFSLQPDDRVYCISRCSRNARGFIFSFASTWCNHVRGSKSFAIIGRASKRCRATLCRGISVIICANQMQPMWQDRVAVQRFQQQLAEVGLSGIQPQFMQWVKWLSEPEITGMARDIILSDAMLGYLHFISGVGANGSVWLYSNVPYKMAMPPAAVLNAWQKAVNEGSTSLLSGVVGSAASAIR